jgi:hypothetical protein
LVINTDTGKIVASYDTNSDTDDVFYDSVAKQIYMSCGSGFIEIFKKTDKDKYNKLSSIETHSGARTSLFVPELNQLIVAAPARLGKEAQLMVYQVK